MTLPAVVLGFVLATLYASLYHLWRDGGFRRFLVFILLSWAGFWAGQVGAAALDITFGQIGTLLLGTATAGSLLFLLVGDWLLR